MSHMCKRIFKFELQLSSYSQNIKFSRYCPKFHIFTNIVILQVYLQLFRTTASSLWISWQGHVRNTRFHFCQLPPVNVLFIVFLTPEKAGVHYVTHYNVYEPNIRSTRCIPDSTAHVSITGILSTSGNSGFEQLFRL